MEGYIASGVNLSKRLKNLVKANQSLAHIESLNDLLPQLLDLAQEVTGVGLQKVVYKSGMKLREGFFLPYSLFQVFMQSLKSNCVSCVTTRSVS